MVSQDSQPLQYESYSNRRDVRSVGTRTPTVRKTKMGLQLGDGMGGDATVKF
jgi:hypothetical protein